MKVAKSRGNPIVAHLHQVPNERMDVSVEYSRIKVILRFKCSWRNQSRFCEHLISFIRPISNQPSGWPANDTRMLSASKEHRHLFLLASACGD
jgi:hypothetical protein